MRHRNLARNIALRTFGLLMLTVGAARAATSAAEPVDDIQEVTITALRSSTTEQETPAAVTVVSGQLLAEQNIGDIRAAQVLIPSAHFGLENSATQVFLRGVGSSLDYPFIPENVAFNFNGVYLPRFATGGSFYDLDSLQVLPGPQGVLYGRSAGGGAIVVNSNRPTNHTEAQGEVEYGNYNFIHLSAMGNTPIGDRVALRVAVDKSSHDGYESLGNDAADTLSARLSLTYKPTDDLSLFVWGTYFQQRGKPLVVSYIPYLHHNNPWYAPAVDPVTGYTNDSGFMHFNYAIGGVEAKYRAGPVTFQYSGSVLQQREDSQRDLVGNLQPLHQNERQYTQSLKFFVDSTAPLQVIGGIDWYYAHTNFNVFFGPNRFGDIFPLVDQRNLSGFLQGTYSFTPAFRFVVGARTSEDSLMLDGNGNACFGICFLSPISYDQSWRHTDAKLGIEYDVAHNVMFYANAQTGYSPGTLNTYPNDVLFSKEVRPQTLRAYTSGVKSAVGGELLTLNLEGYYYQYKDLIIQSFNDSIGQNTLFNAPHATIYGAQFMSRLRPTDRDSLTANVAYTHGRYGSFVATQGGADLDGLQMQYTPDWSATLALEHQFVIGANGEIDARLASNLSSKYWGTFDHSADTDQKEFTRTDFSITYKSPSDEWNVGLWVKNLENAAVKSTVSASGYAPPYAAVTFLDPPRTFGLSLRVKL